MSFMDRHVFDPADVTWFQILQPKIMVLVRDVEAIQFEVEPNSVRSSN